ncbi:MAG TPA: SelT/SelW/SelH family protein [Caldilineae bacterium]|nr:SelT/SelW/SelH family protein [Caldilineae bacterium]
MTEQLLSDFEPEIEELTLIPSDGGVYEVEVDGELIYSKKQTGRHAEYEEVKKAIQAKLNR